MGVQLTQNQELVPAASTVVLMRHPGCAVTENDVDREVEYLQPPFSLPPNVETEFTRETVKALDLTRMDTDDWTENDRRALTLLMRGWSRLNTRGLR
jgi:hypothetical protein